jgi:rod shape-determining protein MreB
MFDINFNLLRKHLAEFDIGLDAGTSNIRISTHEKGILVNEPTVLVRPKKILGQANHPFEVVAIGRKAKQMSGKLPRHLQMIEPIVSGVIADFDACFSLLERFFSLVGQTPGKKLKLLPPRVLVAVSSGATQVEKRAFRSLAIRCGAGRVFLAEKPLLAAIGMGLPVDRSSGSLVVDLGGGTTEIGLISLGGIVLSRCLRTGGKDLDEAIVNYLRLKYGILVGLSTGERIKIELGSAYPIEGKEKDQMIVRGRDLESGLPKSIRLRRDEVREAMIPLIQRIVTQIKELLEEMPAELTNDVLNRGIGLAGGSAQILGLDKLISEETKMPVWVDEDPLLVVAKGAAALLKDKRLLKNVKLVSI